MRIDTTHQPSNLSPTKQKFNTFKNFLKNKSSLNDLRSKAERKDKDKEKEKDDIIYLKPEIIDSLRESKSATRLSEFRLKVPKKKRSLGSLIPHNQSQKLFDSEAYNQLLAPQMSPPTLIRDTSVSTRSSKTSKQSPPKLSFTHDDPLVSQKQFTPVHTPELPFSTDWATPASIRGTYVHDWSDNMSPRSLTESLRVGRVGNLSPKIQFPESPETKVIDRSAITNIDFISESEQEAMAKPNMKLDLSNIVEPSDPLPSPCTVNTQRDTDGVVSQSSHVEEGDNSTSSADSVLSNSSEFSFVVNRAASVRFYKSKEQLQREAAIDVAKKEKQKVRDFLGTSEETEFELLEGFLSNSKKIISGFDEDVNYVNYEEDDDTDALFNRDLFGISSAQQTNNLELFEEDGADDGFSNYDMTSNNEYHYKPPATLELSDDEYNYNPPLSLELSDNEMEHAKGPCISNYKDEPQNMDGVNNLAAQHVAAKSGPKALDNKGENNSVHENGTEKDRHDIVASNGEELSGFHADGSALDKLRDERIKGCLSPNESLKSVVDTSENGSYAENQQPLQTRSCLDLSSKQLLKMLNKSDSGLSFRPQSPEVQIKHTPSAKLQRHRSLKFHQLSADIEEHYNSDNYKEDFQWRNSRVLEEVNSIPEEFNFESDYESLNETQSFPNNFKKGRLSTMIVPNSNNNEITFTPNKIDGKRHVWKNLIPTNGKNKKTPLSERIQLDDKTITLFNRSISDNQKPFNDYKSNESDPNELSTIIE